MLDLIGWSTAPDDVHVFGRRIDQLLDLVFLAPWWLPWVFAFFSTGFLMWVSWPRESRGGITSHWKGDARETRDPVAQTEELQNKIVRPADLKLVAFIDDIYPIAHDLSELHIDAMGDRSAIWKQYFLDGLATDYFEMMQEELRHVSSAYEPLRKLIQRHKVYDTIFEFEDRIASKINAVATALAPVREKAGHLSNRFDEASLSIVAADIANFQQTIGRLRILVGREFLGCLADARRNEMARTV
ncbi:hypothetical protein [Rhizobium sp. SL42]|uniref:hypothetical protein n=1 Tax=Rhizobium sp. SL42 TaxID=2806346 RepID=UPI001F28105C|nr:hypothetical protein [Rhizobium sp. SL42]UJW73745.1 hypothetical protein IM739_12660 [Rhizobium sp. SL42]